MIEPAPRVAASRKRSSTRGPMRLRRIIILETVLVALIGFMAWGMCWEEGYPRVGLGVAIVIWLTISPVIEIATVMKYRRHEEEEDE